MTYWSMMFDGRTECVRDARRFAVKAFGAAPGIDLVELVVSELAGNAVLHSKSGSPGGKFHVHLAVFTDYWHVRVDDEGGLAEPTVCCMDAEYEEAGRGLAMVAEISSEWGVFGNEVARAVWAKIPIPKEEAP